MRGPALQVFAGPSARTRLRERGLQPADVAVMPAAAGGPKGLILNPLDRFLFGEWLPRSKQPIQLLGASIGAWRMAAACLDEPVRALQRLADDYIGQRYEHAPGKAPTPAHVSTTFGAQLRAHFEGREHEVLAHPRWRLQVFTSRGRRLLTRDGRVRTPLGYAAAFASNAVHRRALGGWLERVVFGDLDQALPLADLRSTRVALDRTNLVPAIQASCSIPIWFDAVRDIPGGPPGAYWDGGITDYHLHLDFPAMTDGLVLYPHFQPTVVPGWLDKPFKARHRASAKLDNVVLLAPHPDWVRGLPQGKLPDRNDFKAFVDDDAARERVWRRALAESEGLAEEFAALVRRPSIDALPLP